MKELAAISAMIYIIIIFSDILAQLLLLNLRIKLVYSWRVKGGDPLCLGSNVSSPLKIILWLFMGAGIQLSKQDLLELCIR